MRAHQNMAGLELSAACHDQLQQLTRAGVRAVLDPRDVNPPCVLLMPPAVSYAFRHWDATWTAYALATDAGPVPSLVQLSRLVADVQAALGGAVTTGEPADVTLPDGAGQVPAYALTWTSKLPTS
jgi:hypothetical protein